tara:strand:- start:2411 stop:3283 length:873 start_codon:yes stop_codon:yes gene_type:complete
MNETLVKTTGKLIVSDKSDQLSSLNKSEIFDLLDTHGYILFRGFDTSLKTFSEFVQKMSSKITLDPARKFHEKNAQRVDAGIEEVGLHIENGNGPIIPDLCWFYCKEAPERGSQTTVCDGKAVFENMPYELKQIFRKETITYSRNVSKDIWRAYIAHELGGQVAPEHITIDHLRVIQEKLPNLETIINEDGSLHYSFTVSPLLMKGNETYFANSILGPSFNYEKPTIKFSNGIEVNEYLVNDLKKLTDEFTENIEWKDGDMVLINNQRVMHGRRKITAKKREIYNALSFR